MLRQVKIFACVYVDDGVSLDVVHVRVAEPELFPSPLRSADDPRRHRVLE